MIYIGIDNGVSGSIGIIGPNAVKYMKTPIRRTLDYTKHAKFINRIDVEVLRNLLTVATSGAETKVYIERPMVNPGRFMATASAVRALEATLIVIEELKLPYQYIDSKEWQKKLLPSGLEKHQLKTASLEVAKRIFPQLEYKGFSDGDGILIAEYARCKDKEE